ncbi:hypothetical protein GGR52DRAFT_580130 [Hypoxylon sp. FL1284]|nr:hypothetical protein GGR52DRAFT_580130 [Hypoxylon sp. FL1284]
MAVNRASRALWRESTLPQIVDKLAGESPGLICGIWPVEQASYLSGVREITYADLSNIVNGLAWWLSKSVGHDQHEGILAYFGPNDVRFTAMVLATMKTGHGLFSSSPRNSAAAHRGLFDTLDCQTLVTSDPTNASVQAVFEAVKPCQLIGIPRISELLQTAHPLYSAAKSLDESLSEVLFPLIWTQETAVRHIEAGSREYPNGLTSIDSFVHGKRVLSTLPPFHGAGLLQYLLQAIPFGNTVVVPVTSGAIVTARGIVEALQQTPVDVAVMVPSVVAELANDPELLDYCAKHLELILYIGGDLPQSVGDSIAAKIPLRCWWGASEVGMPQQMIVPELAHYQGGWRYLRFHPCAGAVFEEVDEGIYELVIRREKMCLDTQPSFTIRSQKHLEEYRTRDLFERHPTVPDTWCWRARADDIIVFLNGEKTNPVSMEQYIVAQNSDVVGGALVVGAQRFQAALLIEPAASLGPLTTAEQASLIERVRPSVEEANRSAPAHARVESSLIMVATPHSFIRAGKGTIQRAASIAQYAAEIDSLYMNAETVLDADIDGGETTSAQLLDLADVQTVERAIRNTVKSVTGWSETEAADHFFDRGMDSLQALRLARAMRKALSRPGLSLSTIYQNPNAVQLAAALVTNTDATYRDEQGTARQLLATYRGLIQQIPNPQAVSSGVVEVKPNQANILLTGSTGSLGSSILSALLTRPGIGHVFCLNRATDGGLAAQSKRFAAVGLGPSTFADRVTFLQANLASPQLGLETSTYDELRARVTMVIHNAWPVNFNLALLGFRPQLAGLVNLFAFAATRAIRTVFVSSVGAVAGLGPAAAEETVPDDSSLDASLLNGYARSKLVAEMLCNTAAHDLGLPVDVLRVGQVGGSAARGGAVWNPAEWLPSLVLSSLMYLRYLPDDLGPVFSEIDWIPSDVLGSVVADLVLVGADRSSGAGAGADVYNIRSPQTTTWGDLVPSIQEEARTQLEYAPQVVSSAVWLARLKDSEDAGDGKVGEDVMRNPAIKLLDFYGRGLWPQEGQSATAPQTPMAVRRSMNASATLREMSRISSELVRKWVTEWIEGVSN